MLPLLLVLPFLFSVLAMAFSGVGRRTTSWLAGAVPLGGLAILAALTPAILDGEIIRWSVPWVPQLGLALSLRLDGYAWMFAGLVLGIGGLVVMYAHYYLGPEEKRSEEHTSELQSRENLVCRLLLEKKKKKNKQHQRIYRV